MMDYVHLVHYQMLPTYSPKGWSKFDLHIPPGSIGEVQRLHIFTKGQCVSALIISPSNGSGKVSHYSFTFQLPVICL